MAWFRKKSPADQAIEALPQAIDVAAQKWLEFQRLPFRDDVPLEMKIMAFLVPLQDGLSKWDAFRQSPDAIFFIIACKGVEKSGTHSTEEIERAIGLPLPQ